MLSSRKSNTLFLPLKILTDSDQQTLTESADQALLSAVELVNLSFVSRQTAQEKFNYQGSWPPPHETISTIATANVDYVVAGSLTRTGNILSVDMVVYDLLDKSQVKYFYDEARSIDELKNMLARITKTVNSYTNRFSRVAEITVSGNKKIDTGAIIQRIKIAPGDQYDPALLRQAIKDIYQMGYFEDIEIQLAESEQGHKITFAVQEKAIIGQIIISGEKEIAADEIREIIEIVPNNIISTTDVKKSIENIKQLYKDKGYYNTKVATELNTSPAGKVEVKFMIDEGQKVYIKDITITGNKAFKARQLTKILETSERGWLSWITDSGVLNHDIVEQDSARLAAFYHNNGYIDAKVGTPEITQKEGWIYINFNIFEGDRFRVGIVDLAGDLIEDKTSLLALSEVATEEFFSRKTLRDDVLRLTDKYAENGYAFAEVRPITEKDPLNKRVNIKFDIDKKELVYINRIIVKGNTRTRDKVIRRAMTLKETGIFNATAMKNSHKRLQRLDFFESVDITPEPTADESLMDIYVNVKEKATGNFSIGAGYSTYASFMFMAEVSQNNFLGKGQHMALQANISGNSTQYNLKFTEPHLADSKLLFGLDLYDWKREFDDYDKDSQGIGLRFGYPVWEKWSLSGGYSFDDTNLTDVRTTASKIITDSQDIKITSSVRLGISRDSRNRYPDPSAGATHSLSMKYAGGPLGGDSEFTKFEGTSNWYHELPWETTLHNQLSAGVTFANSGNKLPVFEKFYLGGINSIRGFKSSSISPRDPDTNEKIGGGKMWYYNLEWVFPLVKDVGLKGLTFFDAGNVYSEHGDWDFGDIKKSVGFGFRWLSPMGPLRLEWGYNLDPEPYEIQDNWDFTMGGSF